MPSNLTRTAWALLYLLRKKHGQHALMECLFGWFTVASRTTHYEDAGIHLLLSLPEEQAVEVLSHCYRLLEGKDRSHDSWQKWEPFVQKRDWPCHQQYHHPNKMMQKIWDIDANGKPMEKKNRQ